MSASDLRAEFFRSLTSRLELILPVRSGYTLAEVELNAQFILTANIFFANCKSFPRLASRSFMSYILESLVAILEKLNIDLPSKDLKKRDDRILTSTLVLTKLLSALVRFNWVETHDVSPTDTCANSSDINFNYELSNSPDSLHLYGQKPPSPLQVDIPHVLEVLISLISEDCNRAAMADMRRLEPEISGESDYDLTSNDILPEVARQYVGEIDNHILVVLRYLAVSNASDYLKFVLDNLFAWPERGQYIPSSVLHKYANLVRFVYTDEVSSVSYSKQIYNAIPFIRSHTWKQLFLYFASLTLQIQSRYRPDFYTRGVRPGGITEQNCKLLFDIASTVFEDQPYTNPTLFASIVLTCPSDFDEMLQKPNKLKQAFNKRVKYLYGLLKDAQNGAGLDCFESLIYIFTLGSHIPNLHGGVREFSVHYLDETYANLRKIRERCIPNGTMSRFVSLIQKFLIAAIVIKPDVYIEEFSRLYQPFLILPANDCKEGCLCGFVLLSVRIIKGLSAVPQYRPYFIKVLSRMHKTMRQMLMDAFCRLHEYEMAHSSWVTPETILANPIEKQVNPIEERSTETDKPTVSSPLSHALKKNLDYGIGYVNDMPAKNPHNVAETSETVDNILETPSDTPPAVTHDIKCIKATETILSDLMVIFTAAPEYYYCAHTNFSEANPFQGDDLLGYAEELCAPLRLAIRFKSVNGNSELFEAACALAMTPVKHDNAELRSTQFKQCICFVLSHYIIKAIFEACMFFSLTDPKFKLCFIFVNRFLQERDHVFRNVKENPFLKEPWVHTYCPIVCDSVEIILLLAMCTHDVQLFGMAEITMKWYLLEVREGVHPKECTENTLSKTFKRILDDDSVFTGFVSLHKKLRSILMDAGPTTSLYHVWLLIYQRWLDMIAEESNLGDERLLFRHYTGCLVATSGCFLDQRFSKGEVKDKEKATSFISAFFDRAIHLLKSSDLVIRVVIKDALSNESHSAVFHLVCNKLMNVALYYIEQEQVTDEAILFIEQLITILTAMVYVDNDGSFALVALLPDVCQFLIKFISMVTNPTDNLKLKLRFCKLGYAVESDRVKNGICGSYKLRNHFAKVSADWLEQSIFQKTDESGSLSDLPSILSSPLSASAMQSKSLEIDYLQMELASECSKCLEMQLQDLILEIPEGTKEKNIKQSKDLIFSNYFSLFYKIIQKHTSSSQSPLMLRSKYKVQTVTDNVLKSISNLLESDNRIGMQFVLPLGYHENKKIRSIFLNIFASMLVSRKRLRAKDDFPEEIVGRLAEVCEVYGAAAEIASAAEYNLLATSLHGLFGYTKMLDKLFITLLQDEIGNVTRSSEIFRRNSTLTRLMSLFGKEYGLPYLTVLLKPFIEDLVDQDWSVEVEKSCSDESIEIFMQYLTKLVDTIANSVPWVPDAFKFICSEIRKSIVGKFEEASLVAVGSFIFLRFFCPAIVSPESFFDMPPIGIKVKRSLMQLVKVLQYIANDSLGMLKWPGLQGKSQELEVLNKKIFGFLEVLANTPSKEKYPFHRLTVKPYSCLRYLHKFLYVYDVSIKHRFILGDPLAKAGNLHERVLTWRQLDGVLKDLGDPKPYISLQGTTSYKSADNLGNSQYSEFMAKMSAKNIEMTVDVPVVHSAVYHDGTPVVVINFRYIKDVGYDISTFVFLILETASQVWDNKFYLVHDFTQFFYMGIIGRNYVSLMRNYAPAIYFKNCARSYCFNLPRANYLNIIGSMFKVRIEEHNKDCKVYFYSQNDEPSIINKLCLEESTVAINHEVWVIYKDCLLYDENTLSFIPVTIRLGRRWLQICFQSIEYDHYFTATSTVTPVETHLLSDLTKCEVSNKSKRPNEFTLFLNKYNYEVTIISSQRQEILRFFYFAMLRTSRKVVDLKAPEDEKEEQSQWFGRLYNIVFHGLLESDENVRSASSNLFASLSTYFDIDFGISTSHANLIAYPVDTTEFVVSVSTYLSKKLPERTFRFLKAFFNSFQNLPPGLRISGIMCASPWVENVGDQVHNDNEGPAKVAEITRQFCRITVQNKSHLSFINEYVWKKLFSEMRLTSILMDELIAYTIENKTESSEWDAIISVISSSIELCGEVVSRMIDCIKNTRKDDSEIASQTKLLEITVLAKICASLFFNSYVYGSLYLPDVFFFCTLFIDSPSLDFGSDLQKLVINTIQSFNHKPDLTAKQRMLINNTIDYFSGQRARMLFGMTSRDRAVSSDYSQHYSRSTAFELFCEYLNDFMLQMGSADDRTKWMTRWASLSMDIAFSNSSYRKRAILAVCTFARSGISDATSGRILKLLGRIMFDDFETYTNVGICYARLEEGLASDSVYLPLIIWAQVASAMIRISTSYQAIAASLTNSLCKIPKCSNYIDYVFDHRNHLEPLFSKFETRLDRKITRTNFEFNIFFIISSGLTSSQFRHNSILFLKKVLKQRFLPVPDGETSTANFAYNYLFLLWLALSESAFLEFMTKLELQDISMTTIGKSTIPDVVIENLANGSDFSRMTFILASYIFSKASDVTITGKFIAIYSHLFKTARSFAMSSFHIVRGGLENGMINSLVINVVDEIAGILVSVIQDGSYSSSKYELEVKELLTKYDFMCMDQVGDFVGTGSEALKSKTTFSLAKMIQDMLYRSFCSVMEGQRLEKF